MVKDVRGVTQMRCAAVDIGTNSCRLLIAEIEGEQWRMLLRTMVTTRIGEGVESQRIISPAAMERTLRGLQGLKEHIARYRAERVRAVGTSALRDAVNREEFVEKVHRELGWQVDIISGEEEARLSYLGVKLGLSLDRPPLVVDLGGGSTEFMLENPHSWNMSLPVGAVRAAETGMSDQQIREMLQPLASRISVPDHPMVAVGGTATTLVAMERGLKEYDSRLVHGQKLALDQVKYWRDHLSAMTLEERRQVTGLQPERADIIVPGLRILALIMEQLDYDHLLVSESDILDGIIAGLRGN